MATCVFCHNPAVTRCSFCGGQSGRTVLCRTHLLKIRNETTIAESCLTCATIKIRNGLWMLADGEGDLTLNC